MKIPDGTPAFQKGFRDGCETVNYARGNVFYRSRYGYRYDPKMISNSEYRFGHSRGYSWCFYHVLSPSTGPQASVLGFVTPTYDTTFNKMHINATWGDMFSGSGSGVMGGSTSSIGGGLDGIWGALPKGVDGSGNAGVGQGALGHPFWASGSTEQIFGQ